MKRIACVVGARPNFMKIAPVLRAMQSFPQLKPTLIHTGQHYDAQLSDVFFQELEIQPPDISLNIGSGTHGKQTGDIIAAVETILLDAQRVEQPYHRMLVVGDVNSTMAAAIAAVKLNVPVAHIEAGLRSFDRSMPEEINRIVTDSICDVLLVSEPSGAEQLRREGHGDDQIFVVGNVMIDTLRQQLQRSQQSKILSRLGIQPGGYGVVTMHRPSNVDQPATLAGILDALMTTAGQMDLVFPVHPRTRERLKRFNLLDRLQRSSIRLLEPLGYLDFLALTSQARVIVTDSGGLQEESTALGVPCLTLRNTTERPITVNEGTSVLVGNDATLLARELTAVLDGSFKRGGCPVLWDGMAAVRIVEILAAVTR